MLRKQQEPPFLRRLREKAMGSRTITPVVRKGRLHRFADWLDGWHLTRIFQALSSFLLVLAFIGFYIDFEARKEERAQRQFDRDMAQEEREARQINRKVSAWQLLTTKASGNSGKIDALEYLHSQGEPLHGIDLSVEKGRVYLVDVQLANAKLNQANLQGAHLDAANLQNAELWWANLQGADLGRANLQGADLGRANLQDAHLWLANLQDADLGGANLQDGALFKANLQNADLEWANLVNVKFNKKEPCVQLQAAKKWETAYRDKKMACGASLPEGEYDFSILDN